MMIGIIFRDFLGYSYFSIWYLVVYRGILVCFIGYYNIMVWDLVVVFYDKYLI